MSNSQEKEKILDSINYLDWYFGEDDGGADKDAVKAYDVLRTTVFRLYREYESQITPLPEPPKEEKYGNVDV